MGVNENKQHYGYDDCTVKCEWWPNEFWIFPMYTCLPQQKLLNLTFKWQMCSSVEGTKTIEAIDNHTFANEASADKVIWSQTKSSAIQHPFISKLLFQSERIYRRISHYQWMTSKNALLREMKVNFKCWCITRRLKSDWNQFKCNEQFNFYNWLLSNTAEISWVHIKNIGDNYYISLQSYEKRYINV